MRIAGGRRVHRRAQRRGTDGICASSAFSAVSPSALLTHRHFMVRPLDCPELPVYHGKCERWLRPDLPLHRCCTNELGNGKEMSQVSEFFSANIVLIYFVYGLAFFSLGLVMALEARAPARLHHLNH